jgi:glycosyltransferase involved in cell wall biosynthesis
MRYLWGFQDEYFSRFWFPLRFLINTIFYFLKKEDLKSNQSVDLFIANSEFIRKRIEKLYQRNAVVVHPPLDNVFYSAIGERQNYYLAVSHFVPYKRIDVVIEAFNKLDRKLIVVGSGPLESRYKELRKSDQIVFLGGIHDEELRKVFSGAKALIFPAEEDFGIVPLEAQACGTPVIAYKKGGALETVKSGLFFEEQTPEAVQEAVRCFEKECFDPIDVSKKVQMFGRKYFLENMNRVIGNYYSQKQRLV